TFAGERLAEALPGSGQEGSCSHVADAERRGELEARQVMELGEQESGPLPLGDLLEGSLQVARQMSVHHEAFRGWRRAVALTGPRHEAYDLLAADVVERDAMGDLVEPGPRVLGLLEHVVVAIGLDEGVLRQVRGELGVAEHPDQVRVDLAVMRREELLDEARGGVLLPRAGHGGSPTKPAADAVLVVERAGH